MKYVSIYLAFIKMDIRRVIRYRLNLIVGNIGYSLESLATLFSVLMILNLAGSIGGWNAYEILFLFSFILVVKSIWEFFLVTTLEIPLLILEGELDIFLIRPLNPLFQFIIFELDEESIFEMLFAIALLVFSIIMLDLHYSVLFWIMLPLFIFSGVMTLQAIYLTICSTCFWFVSNDGLMKIIWEVYEMGQYPFSIYPMFIKIVLTIIPLGFIGFYPSNILLNMDEFSLVYLLGMIVIGPVFLLLSYFTIWKIGLRNYTSSGS